MKWTSLLWHAPGRMWAGMISAASVKTWLTAGAAIAWSLIVCGLVWLFRPVLTSDHAFWIIQAAHGLVLVAIVALTGTEISFRAGKDGVNANVGQDVEPVAQVTTTTTVSAPVKDDDAQDPTMYGGPRA